MKKLLLSFVLLLMTALGVQAQGLEGKWVTQITDKEPKGDFYLIFNPKKLDMKIVSKANEKEFNIKLSVNMEASYTLKDNVINFTLKSNKTNIKIEDLEMKGEMADEINGNPEMKKEVIKMLQKEFDKEIGKNSDDLSSLTGGNSLTILSNNGKELVIKGADGTVMNFKKVK